MPRYAMRGFSRIFSTGAEECSTSPRAFRSSARVMEKLYHAFSGHSILSFMQADVQLVEVAIDAAVNRHKRLMTSLFNDGTVLDDEDRVCRTHS